MSKKNGPKPFFRKPRKRWYVEIDGHQINLGPDEVAARARWHQLMSGTVPAPTLASATSAPTTGVLVCRVLDLFVGWSHKHRPERTAGWYQNHLQSFLDSLPDAPTLTVEH